MRITSTVAALLVAFGIISGLGRSTASSPTTSTVAAVNSSNTMVWDGTGLG